MQPITVKGMTIGEGMPKIIVSIMEADIDSAIARAQDALDAGADCLEWRADFSANVRDADAMARDAITLREALPEAALLFTFRSTGQGGRLTLPIPEYAALNKAVIATGAIDMVDIESWIGDSEIRPLVQAAHEAGAITIISHHDFDKTPCAADMVEMMRHMQDLGADIPKIAVMARSAHDALELLQATERMMSLHANGPLLTMAMGAHGAITRLVGEQFGSAMTFCALGAASAPGQVEISEAASLMKSMHGIGGACD